MKMIRVLPLALAALFAAYGCSKETTFKRPETTVVVAKARNAEIAPSFSIIAQAKAYDSVDLIARVQGFLLKRNFREGDFVKKGALLFEIEPDKYQADVQKGKAAVERAQANLKNAMLDYQRQRKLVIENAVSKREYDRAEAHKGKCEAELLDAKATLKEAELDLSYTKIYAPFDGIIGIAEYSVGNMVRPMDGKLANIARINPIRVEFSLSETILLELLRQNEYKHLELKEADKRSVDVELVFQNGKVLDEHGYVAYIDNRINPTTGTLRVQALFANKKRLVMPGMYLKARIVQKEKIKALMIPRRAVQEDQSGKFVMLVNAENKVERRDISTGLTSGLDIQVLKGLEPNDMVITEGIMNVTMGDKVRTILDEQQTSSPEEPKKQPDTNSKSKIETSSGNGDKQS